MTSKRQLKALDCSPDCHHYSAPTNIIILSWQWRPLSILPFFPLYNTRSTDHPSNLNIYIYIIFKFPNSNRTTSHLIYNKAHLQYLDLKVWLGLAWGHLSHFIPSFSSPLLIVLLISASFLCSEIVEHCLLRSCVHTFSSAWHALYFYLLTNSQIALTMCLGSF